MDANMPTESALWHPDAPDVLCLAFARSASISTAPFQVAMSNPFVSAETAAAAIANHNRTQLPRPMCSIHPRSSSMKRCKKVLDSICPQRLVLEGGFTTTSSRPSTPQNELASVVDDSSFNRTAVPQLRPVGHRFFISANGMWPTDHMPPFYVVFPGGVPGGNLRIRVQ
jgi:hypothetical protein